MKKIFTYSIAVVLVVLLVTSCAKERVAYDDTSYWLSQERGQVIYSSNYCGIYVVETNYGYTLVENTNGLRIYEGDVVYGNFGVIGTRDFYNYTANLVTRGTILEYDLSYNSALDALDYYCPAGRAYGFNLKQSASSEDKLSRTVSPAKTIK